MIRLKQAETNRELQDILILQKKNLKENISTEELNQEGFVTLNHSMATLELMNSYEGQIIAVEDGVVIGYALVMVSDVKDEIPVLKPMFELLNVLSYKYRKISESKYYIMGQVCIEKSYRGKGIFAKLYDKHKEALASKYEYCITEVSSSNVRSLKAHAKVGFETIHSFSDVTDTWNILLLNLRN